MEILGIVTGALMIIMGILVIVLRKHKERMMNMGNTFNVVTRNLYDSRKLGKFIFTQDFSINNKALYLKGDEYDTYHYNYERLAQLVRDGILIEKERP